VRTEPCRWHDDDEKDDGTNAVPDGSALRNREDERSAGRAVAGARDV